MPYSQACLVPPTHTSFEVDRQEDGYWRLSVWAGDAPGLRRKSEKDLYEGLTIGEVTDIVEATLAAYAGTAGG